jgi:Uma2 family endonuclease
MPVSAQPVPPALSRPPAVPDDIVWRLTLDQYHEMVRSGILGEDDPVELLDGWLITKMPKNPARRAATGLVREALERSIPAGWHVDTQEPITLERSEPEPDVAVVRGERRDYLERHPGPRETGLVVEVADSSLERDRGFKKRLYAEAGIPTYWILNLLDRQLEVNSEPAGDGETADYRRQQIYAAGGAVPVVLDGRQVARLPVEDVLPLSS